ncbi:MAG TPA: hypothetical protein PKE57_02965, partial [Cellvibrionaceae bacterium]|nr:hypothetical protein [Cellvibrionaceae bacterium]
MQQGKVTAQSSEGAGGDIKLLGNKVGVVDKADVNASGRKGGGQVLLGGDQSGKNPNINNAEFLFVGEDAEVHADANELNNGGRIIAFALDTARIYGELSVKGGLAGSGGFVETSGLQGLEVGLAPDITALSKNAGHWLIDPYDIVIDGNSSPSVFTATANSYTPFEDDALIGWNIIRGALSSGNGAQVTISTGTGGSPNDGNIYIAANLDFNVGGTKSSTLILDAAKDIKFGKSLNNGGNEINATVTEVKASNGNKLSFEFKAGGNIDFGATSIITNGGDIKIGSSQVPIGGTVSAANATLNTSATNGAGDITIDAKGNVSLGVLDLSRTFNSTATKAGSLTVTSQGSISFEKNLDFNNFAAYNGANSSNENWTLPNNTPEADKKTTFTLNAAGDINFKGNIFDSYGDGRDGLNIVANADAEVMTGGKDGTGSVIVGNTVYTSGGNVEFTGAGIQFGTSALIDTDRANSSPDNAVTGNGGHGNATRSEGGNVILSSDGNIVLGAITTDHFCTLGTCTGDLTIQNRSSDKSISITQAAGKALSVHGTTTLKTNGGNITLGEAGNIFGTSGANAGTNSNDNNIDTLVNNAKVAAGKTIAITNAGSSTIKGDNSYLTLGNVSAQGLSLSTTKDIRQFGGTSIDANTAAFKGTSVLLINNGNKLGTVTSLETTATSAGSASINVTQDITLSALNIASGQLGLSM